MKPEPRYLLYTKDCKYDAAGKDWEQTGGTIQGSYKAKKYADSAKKNHGCKTKLVRVDDDYQSE